MRRPHSGRGVPAPRGNPESKARAPRRGRKLSRRDKWVDPRGRAETEAKGSGWNGLPNHAIGWYVGRSRGFVHPLPKLRKGSCSAPYHWASAVERSTVGCGPPSFGLSLLRRNGRALSIVSRRTGTPCGSFGDRVGDSCGQHQVRTSSVACLDDGDSPLQAGFIGQGSAARSVATPLTHRLISWLERIGAKKLRSPPGLRENTERQPCRLR